MTLPFRPEIAWAVRHVRRRPVFTVAFVATLSLGIAAASIAYGLATAILWRPLPFHDPDRLVFVWEARTDRDNPDAFRVTGGRYAEWRDHAKSFSSLALFGAAPFSLDTIDGGIPVSGVRVSAGYFATLGVTTALGRTFTSDDEIPGRNRVLVASHGFWRDRLGGRADIIGTSVRLNGEPYTVVGVMPPMTLPGWPVNPAEVTIGAATRELWVPIARTPALDASTRAHVFGVIGRLAQGTTVSRAADEVRRMASPTAADVHGGTVTPVRTQLVRDAKLPLLALLGAAGALLLVACANLAALEVSHFETRRAELAVRTALGASSSRLAAQITAEMLLPAAAAGAVGIVAARAVLAVVSQWLPPEVPFLTPPSLDLRVALFAALLTICAAALVAAWPLAQLRRSGPAPRGVAGESRPRVFRVLLVTQVSVTVALAVSAALLVRSLLNVRSNDPGYLVDGIVTAEIGLPRTLDTPQKIAAVEDGVRGHLEGRPGIRGIAVAYDRPLEANWSDVFRLASDVDAGEDVRGQAELRIVSPSYFDAMGVQVLAGRPFTVDDGLERPGIALVNESFARAHGGALIGRRLHSSAPRFTWGSSAPDEFEIAGIVEDERFRGLEHPSAPAVYLSTRQFPQTGFTLLIRTASGAGVGGREVRAAVRAVEPAAAVGTLTTLGRLLDDQLVARRVTADVVGGLSGLSLGLAALGVYGVLAMLVSSRAREIGVRLALGATPAGVAWRVVRESLVSVTPGIVGGLVLAFVAGRLLEAFLVGVSGRDPATFALVVLVVVIAAIAASTVPAVRAATVDPVSALRRD